MKYFIESEFPDDTSLASPALLKALDDLRDMMGHPIFPSPVKGALARLDGSKTSRHYAVERLSTACDIFVGCEPFEAYSKVLQSGLFKGIGIYFDTHYAGKDHVMFHLDLRDDPLVWYREFDYKYEYEDNFYQDLSHLLLTD